MTDTTPSSQSQHKPVILLIDDDDTFRVLISNALTEKGYAVLQAKDGAEGITIALHKRPDLVLLDVVMPAMSGAEALAKIRADEWGKRVPILMLTQLEGMDVIAETLAGKANGYIVKSERSVDDIIADVKKELSLVRM